MTKRSNQKLPVFHLGRDVHEMAIETDLRTSVTKPNTPTLRYLERVRDLIAKERGVDRVDVTKYAIAVKLKIAPNRMSLYYLHGGTIENKLAVEVAELIGEKPMKVIAEIEGERAKRDEDRTFWKGVARKVAFVGSAAIGAALLYKLQSVGADSELAGAVIAAVQTGPLCIMSTQAGTLILAAIAVFAVFPELLRAPGSALAHWRDRLFGIPALRLV